MALPRTPERMAHLRSAALDGARHASRPQPHQPVLALTRLPGAHGEEIARRVALRLDYEVYDQELIHAIASSSHHSERVVAGLDERARGLLTQWLTEMMTEERFSPHEYRHHLGRVVGALAHRGAAVIVGRGAHVLVPPELGLRVLLVAPWEERVRITAVERACTEAEARRFLATEEQARRRFLWEHFHTQLADPTAVDLVLNTAALGVARAADLIEAAVRARSVVVAGA